MKDAIRDEMFLPVPGNEKTLNERWNVNPRANHWYGASTEFAITSLGDGFGRSLLVIGSPIFEARALADLGWDLTYMDVRVPPYKPWKFIHCDATKITLPDESFDAISTSCVLTHAGTGRYGDGVNEAQGDEQMLAHIHRVLKKGSKAAITFGGCVDAEKMNRLAAHRIYTIRECERMLDVVGLRILDMKIWSFLTKDWLPAGVLPTNDIFNPDYISFSVMK